MSAFPIKNLSDSVNGFKVNVNDLLKNKKYQKLNASELKKLKGNLNKINETSLTIFHDILKKCTIKKTKSKKSDGEIEHSSEGDGDGEEDIISETSDEKEEEEKCTEIPLFNIDGFTQLVDNFIKKIYDELLNEAEYKELNVSELKKINKALTEFNQIPTSILIEINKKCVGKKEKKEKSSTPNAMDKQNEVESFVPEFMVSQGFEQRIEYSQEEIRKAMHKSVQEARDKDPSLPKGKEYKTPENLKAFYEKINKIIKDDIKVVENDIKEKEKKIKKEPDTKESKEGAKQIVKQKAWIEEKKGFLGSIDIKSYDDFYRYRPFCNKSRDPIEKSIKFVIKKEKK